MVNVLEELWLLIYFPLIRPAALTSHTIVDSPWCAVVQTMLIPRPKRYGWWRKDVDFWDHPKWMVIG